MPQVGCQRAAPRFVEAGVDHRQQRPRQGFRRPRVVVEGAGDLGDQGLRIAERDAGAHPVGAARPAAQHERKPLAQPAFHAAGSDQHQFLRERVGLGIGQQRAEPVGKQIGALGTVQVKRHRASP
ncbi:Uncharacterised protein [Mycobacterium tuberculosis]|uniref:Uncharacterized protein n=1 Tax=Mycobacterium tuberculosis TaxID=1773 RepID=A0A654ZRK7_MYCTX|nr:Uncharacterised protein [Mycobacterium tuberculosis]CKR01547.1 Uncharacterised protein [Mycobacterium tuberculosis]CKR47037.1 Uncharacterised protein [Mycobacterium tuberculosis]CKS78143.1 Uncharacterised protein [Mycobacterium tuberculosis]CKT14254.1 Uncharacterised protein [Mycobacterium tuberculosis]